MFDMDKKFTAKMKKGKKRTIVITRSDFYNTDAPMATDKITDEDMELAARRIAEELDDYPQRELKDDDDFNEAFWNEYEKFLTVALEVQYY